jgi:NAD(P)H-hydrate epimerase
MATAGSGDVLSGILSAVCSFMPELISSVNNKNIPDHTLATAIAAFINGKAGELAQQKTNSISMIAGDTVSCIPDVISGLIYNSDI